MPRTEPTQFRPVPHPIDAVLLPIERLTGTWATRSRIGAHPATFAGAAA